MFNRYGLLVKSDRSENQDTKKDPELQNILNALYISDSEKFVSDLTGWTIYGSTNRCYFYMKFGYQNKGYAQQNQPISYDVPVYGVKGGDAITRDIKYSNQYLQDPADMAGSEFIDYVFGTAYIEEEELQELTSKSMVVERLRSQIKNISHKVEDPTLISRVLERIWAAREKDRTTRVVLIMDDEKIEEQSLDFLRQIYLLLPQNLRMSTGFVTNVNMKDIKAMSGKSFAILTMSEATAKELDSDELEQLGFPVEFVELKAIEYCPEVFAFNQERIALLERHCENISEITEVCMAYAERKVMEREKTTYSSFSYYEEILKSTYSAELYWWNREDLVSIREICGLYKDQMELMEIPQVRNEAIRKFYMECMQKGEYAKEIVDIICEPQSLERDNLLADLRDEFCYGKEIDAIIEYSKKRDTQQENMRKEMEEEREALRQEHANAIKEKEEELQQQVMAMEESEEQHSREIAELEKQKKAEFDTLQQEHADAIHKKEAEIQRQEAAITELEEQHRKKVAELEEAKKNELEKQQQAYTDVIDKKEKELQQQADAMADLEERHRKEVEELKSKIDPLDDADTKELKNIIRDLEKESKELEKESKKRGRLRNIFGIAALVALLGGGAAAGYGIFRMHAAEENKSNLESALEAKQSELTALQATHEEMKNELEAKQSEVLKLESEKLIAETAEAETDTEAKTENEPESESETAKETETEAETQISVAETDYKPYGILW